MSNKERKRERKKKISSTRFKIPVYFTKLKSEEKESTYQKKSNNNNTKSNSNTYDTQHNFNTTGKIRKLEFF